DLEIPPISSTGTRISSLTCFSRNCSSLSSRKSFLLNEDIPVVNKINIPPHAEKTRGRKRYDFKFKKENLVFIKNLSIIVAYNLAFLNLSPNQKLIMAKIQELDKLDRQILSILMNDAKMPYTDIAKKLFVSG